MEFGDRIAQLRTQHKLTQAELAKKVGITRASLSHYEKNRREPDYNTLKRIANFFDVSIDYLIGNENNDNEFLEVINDPELERWFKELPKSDEEDLRKLKKMWEIIKNEEN